MENKKMKGYVNIFTFFFIGLIIGAIIGYFLFSYTPYQEGQPSNWINTDYVNIKDEPFGTNITITSSKYLFIRDANYTGSMEPVMFGGNKLIVINIINKDLIMPGDIIGFKIEDRVIVHRVIEKSYNYYGNMYELVFRTKGDNCSNIDPYEIKSEDILGVVVGILY